MIEAHSFCVQPRTTAVDMTLPACAVERRRPQPSIDIHSYSFISTTVDKTQLCHRAKIKRDGDRTEKKVLELEQLHYTTSRYRIS